MRLSKDIATLLTSGFTLTSKETSLVEDYIASVSQPVKPEHLNHYKCLSAVRTGVGHQ